MGQQLGAASRGALEGQGAAECFDAVGEAAQPAAVYVGATDAVVEDFDQEGAGVVRSADRESDAPACFWALASPSATT